MTIWDNFNYKYMRIDFIKDEAVDVVLITNIGLQHTMTRQNAFNITKKNTSRKRYLPEKKNRKYYFYIAVLHTRTETELKQNSLLV